MNYQHALLTKVTITIHMQQLHNYFKPVDIQSDVDGDQVGTVQDCCSLYLIQNGACKIRGRRSVSQLDLQQIAHSAVQRELVSVALTA